MRNAVLKGVMKNKFESRHNHAIFYLESKFYCLESKYIPCILVNAVYFILSRKYHTVPLSSSSSHSSFLSAIFSAASNFRMAVEMSENCLLSLLCYFIKFLNSLYNFEKLSMTLITIKQNIIHVIYIHNI